jgi:hypothetical protein
LFANSVFLFKQFDERPFSRIFTGIAIAAMTIDAGRGAQ